MRVFPAFLRAAVLSAPLLVSSGAGIGEDKPAQQIQKAAVSELGVKDYDREASRKGMANLLFYVADLIQAERPSKSFLRHSSIQIHPIKLHLEMHEKIIKEVLERNGIKPQDMQKQMKTLSEEWEKFNKTSKNYKHLLIELGRKEISTNSSLLPVLKPKESPDKTLEKYPLAKYSFPIILNKENTKNTRDIDVDAIQYRYYIDPADNKVKKGIHVKYHEDSWVKDKSSEEDRTVLLVPESCNVIINQEGTDVMIIARQPFVRVIR